MKFIVGVLVHVTQTCLDFNFFQFCYFCRGENCCCFLDSHKVYF